jgi:hypothetical protein
MRIKFPSCLVGNLAAVILLGGCSFFSPITPANQGEIFKAQQASDAVDLLQVDATNQAVEITFSDPIPETLKQQIVQAQENQVVQTSAALEVSLSKEGVPAGIWIYVAAAAFPSLQDQITEDQIRNLWQGKPSDEVWTQLYIQEADAELLQTRFGEMNSKTVSLVSMDDAVKLAWQEPHSLFIFPFEQLNPRWKILQFDGVSIFSRPFDDQTYPLAFHYQLSSANPLTVLPEAGLPFMNYDPSKMASVLLTGVTALARATAAKMDNEGVDFPASSIREVLLDADITHISNEVSFAKDCPLADASQATVMFCSRPEYFDLFKSTDVDVVELSGNHLIDWSMNGFVYSLQLYKDAGIAIYAGGENQADARKPYKTEVNGNKIAFLGCNPAGPETVWATDTMPGVANCDDEWMIPAVESLVAEGYLPIVTMQHFETYAMEPNPQQKYDFLNLSAHGAVVVSGSQAHLPQGMAFVGDHFVHYGLGNLFFDQMDIPVVGTRREFLDRHIFYDGKYIQTEIITAMLEDYARPRLMSEEERTQFLTDIYKASGWIKEEE